MGTGEILTFGVPNFFWFSKKVLGQFSRMYKHHWWPSGLSWMSKSGQTDAILKKSKKSCDFGQNWRSSFSPKFFAKNGSSGAWWLTLIIFFAFLSKNARFWQKRGKTEQKGAFWTSDLRCQTNWRDAQMFDFFWLRLLYWNLNW